jgi:hypothetical protein
MVKISSDSMGEDFLIGSRKEDNLHVRATVLICFPASVRLEVGQAYFPVIWG